MVFSFHWQLKISLKSPLRLTGWTVWQKGIPEPKVQTMGPQWRPYAASDSFSSLILWTSLWAVNTTRETFRPKDTPAGSSSPPHCGQAWCRPLPGWWADWPSCRRPEPGWLRTGPVIGWSHWLTWERQNTSSQKHQLQIGIKQTLLITGTSDVISSLRNCFTLNFEWFSFYLVSPLVWELLWTSFAHLFEQNWSLWSSF